HIIQQTNAQPLLSVLPGKGDKGNSGNAGSVPPVCAGRVGYSNERLPDVRITINYAVRHVRDCDSANCDCGPGGETIAQTVTLFFVLSAAVGFDDLVGRSPPHFYDDRARVDRVRQIVKTG